MFRSVFFLIFTVIIINVDCTIPVGYIYNASYISNDTTIVTTYKNTCTECICNGFFSYIPPLYVGLNCYSNTKTCQLFANYSTPSTMTMNLNSTFIFIQLPPVQNTTTTVSYPLIGVTVAGYANGTPGSALNALSLPWGLAIGVDDSLYVADYGNARVMKIPAGSLTGSRVAGTGVHGSTANKLEAPAELAVDANSNIYVNDDLNYRVMLWRKNSTFGVRVAGNGTVANATLVNGTVGNFTSTIGESVGLAVDSQGNIYVSDKANNRVMKWAPNATSGTLVAGVTGISGSSNQQLFHPYGLYLDETNSYLYIADFRNNRIQKYTLGIAANGTTVAGGNGAGSGSNQLNQPYAVCVSKKTGDIYIADKQNHRIQRWSPGASIGVTIIGITGVSGINATLLNGPANVALSMNETFLYVSDKDNNRVQRFKLT